MGLHVVQEVTVPVFGAEEADSVQGGVVGPVLVGLHLRGQETRFSKRLINKLNFSKIQQINYFTFVLDLRFSD